MSGSNLAAVAAAAAAQDPAPAPAVASPASPAAPAAAAAAAQPAAPVAAQTITAPAIADAATVVTATAALELLVVGYPELKGLVEPLAAKAKAGCSEAEFSRAILEAKAGGVTAPAMDTKQGNAVPEPKPGAPATAAKGEALDAGAIFSDRAKAMTS